MVIVGLISWWYGAGWKWRILRVFDSIVSLYDYFSIDLLLKTLFSPFRQISADKVDGPIGVQMRAMLDNLISRVIGAIVRTMVMLIGIVALVIAVVIGAVRIIIWPLIPALPVFYSMCALMGWVPWKI